MCMKNIQQFKKSLQTFLTPNKKRSSPISKSTKAQNAKMLNIKEITIIVQKSFKIFIKIFGGFKKKF